MDLAPDLLHPGDRRYSVDVMGRLRPVLQELLAPGGRRDPVHVQQLGDLLRHGETVFTPGTADLDPEFVLRVALGEALSERGLGLVANADSVAGEALPIHVAVARFSLRLGPGIVLLDSPRPIVIRRPVVLRSGQRLLGVSPYAPDAGAGPMGTVLEWQGDGGPALAVGTAGEQDDYVAIEGIRLRNAGHRSAIGIYLGKCRACRLERLVIRDFGIGIAVDNARRCHVLHVDVRAATSAVTMSPGAASCQLLGSRLVSMGGGPALALAGNDAEIVRCRVERRAPPGGLASPETAPTINVTGARNAVTGCRVIGHGASYALLLVEGPNAQLNLFERNAYSGKSENIVVDRVARMPDFDRPALLDDRGMGTIFRDTARAGFPPVDFSTQNLLINGSFEAWEDQLLGSFLEPGDEALEEPDDRLDPIAGGAFRVLAAPRLPRERRLFGPVPVSWGLAEEPWGPRSAYAQRDEALATVRRFLGSGSPPKVPSFVTVSPPRDGGHFDWFANTSDVHHGAHSLWIGVLPEDGRSETSAAIEQYVRIPRTASRFVVGLYAKVEQVDGARAFLRVLDHKRRLLVEQAYVGNGDWRLLSLSLSAPKGEGTFARIIQCVVTVERKPARACFDRAMLVAGTTLPQYVDYVLTDAGGRNLGGLEFAKGQPIEIRLGAPEARRHSSASRGGDLVDLTLVGQPFELTEDILVCLDREQGKMTGAHGVWIDLRVNGEPMFQQKLVPAMGAGCTVALPLRHVRSGCRHLAAGDLLTLHHSGGVDLSGVQIVLAGHRRRF